MLIDLRKCNSPYWARERSRDFCRINLRKRATDRREIWQGSGINYAHPPINRNQAALCASSYALAGWNGRKKRPVTGREQLLFINSPALPRSASACKNQLTSRCNKVGAIKREYLRRQATLVKHGTRLLLIWSLSREKIAKPSRECRFITSLRTLAVFSTGIRGFSTLPIKRLLLISVRRDIWHL